MSKSQKCAFCSRRAIYKLTGAALGREEHQVTHCGIPRHESRAKEQLRQTGRLITKRELLLGGKLTR